jgi:hypothetical protein
MNSMTSLLLQQLGYRAPVLLTCVVGIILSVIFWRRAPRPSLFVLLAASFEAVVSISNSVAFTYIVTSNSSSSASIGQRLSMVGMVASMVSPVPYILLMIAAFVGRSRQGGAAFPVTFPQGLVPPPPPARG